MIHSTEIVLTQRIISSLTLNVGVPGPPGPPGALSGTIPWENVTGKPAFDIHASPSTVVIRDDAGGVGAARIRLSLGTTETWLLLEEAPSEDRELAAPDASGRLALTSRRDGKLNPHELAPASENVIAAGFTLSVATHANKINILDSGGSAIAISVPNNIPAGHEFVFWRGNTGALSFTGAGVVTGEARLADVVPNSFFGLVSRGSGVFLFV